MMRLLQKKEGYISIESVIVVGLMLALGTFAIQKLYTIGEEQTNHAVQNINTVLVISTSE